MVSRWRCAPAVELFAKPAPAARKKDTRIQDPPENCFDHSPARLHFGGMNHSPGFLALVNGAKQHVTEVRMDKPRNLAKSMPVE